MNKLKYYAFDWDDNLLNMSTQIYLDYLWEEKWISTSKFAEVRHLIGQGEYDLLDDNKSFRDFTVEWDDKFRTGYLVATLWPSWPDFQVCINNARIFSIITARWHSIEAMRETVKEMILKQFAWINVDQFCVNMRNFQRIEQTWNDKIIVLDDENELVDQYMWLNMFYPVSNKNEMEKLWIIWDSVSPELAKQMALKHFVEHIRQHVWRIIAWLYEKPEIHLWASDDDPLNVDWIMKFISNGWIWSDIISHIYSTSWWVKKKVYTSEDESSH